MVMVFTLVSAVQEKLSCLVDEAKKRKTEEVERRLKEEEEAEHVKLHFIVLKRVDKPSFGMTFTIMPFCRPSQHHVFY